MIEYLAGEVQKLKHLHGPDFEYPATFSRYIPEVPKT
jgi:hypothetical protein